ncbi:hypothetical protein [Segatella copri]|uniref:Uncharacterized protein n=1 Tax=Segatella copri TaxID=165179 RepID=A0AA92V1S3_9BACT|nr:hypothetical protein [Segatella copri]RHA86661.1 hypothetical protein DW916_08620 [Segatella copri]
MKWNIFLMILNSKKDKGQIPKMELALLFQISLHLYLVKTDDERSLLPDILIWLNPDDGL